MTEKAQSQSWAHSHTGLGASAYCQSINFFSAKKALHSPLQRHHRFFSGYSKGYRGYMFGVQRPWPVVYWWLACLGRSAGQSSNHNFIIFTPPFDVNGRKFQNQPKVFGRHCFAVGKLNSLFCTCIFIMSTEELEAFSYHQHSFLTEAGRQATPAC